MLKFAADLTRNLLRPPRTEPLEDGVANTPPAYRGRVEVDEAKCVGCSTCAQVCPCNAIRLDEKEDGIRLILWHSHCSFCGLCEFYCPTDAIKQTNDWRLEHDYAEKYVMQEVITARYQHCSSCGEKLMAPRGGVVEASRIGGCAATPRSRLFAKPAAARRARARSWG